MRWKRYCSLKANICDRWYCKSANTHEMFDDEIISRWTVVVRYALTDNRIDFKGEILWRSKEVLCFRRYPYANIHICAMNQYCWAECHKIWRINLSALSTLQNESLTCLVMAYFPTLIFNVITLSDRDLLSSFFL